MVDHRSSHLSCVAAQAFSRLPEHDCCAFSPNFGYQLCVKKVKPIERDQLKLANFVAAINAAEPIRVSTLREFTSFFAPSGAPPKSPRTAHHAS